MKPKLCAVCGGTLTVIPGTVAAYGCQACDEAAWEREYAKRMKLKKTAAEIDAAHEEADETGVAF